MTQNISTDMLHGFVDGQLDDAEMTKVQAYLDENPDIAAEVADWAAQNAAILALYPAPEQVIPLPDLAPATNLSRAPFRAIAASVILLGIGVALGWTGRGVVPQNSEIVVAGLVSEAITAHAVFTADANRPVEIAADQEDLLIGWLSNRIGERLAAPDLSANGFALVGGRLLPSSAGPAAQFMYENAAGSRITLFAARANAGVMAEFTFQQKGKTGSFYWQDERLRYAIIGDLPREELNALAIRVFKAFS